MTASLSTFITQGKGVQSYASFWGACLPQHSQYPVISFFINLHTVSVLCSWDTLKFLALTFTPSCKSILVPGVDNWNCPITGLLGLRITPLSCFLLDPCHLLDFKDYVSPWHLDYTVLLRGYQDLSLSQKIQFSTQCNNFKLIQCMHMMSLNAHISLR